MGLFDNFLKQVDKSLKAIESGELEKRLDKFADTIERTSKKADTTIKTVTDKPGKLLKKAEDKTKDIENKAAEVKKHVGQNMDIIRAKD